MTIPSLMLCLSAMATAPGQIKSDEHVIFFPTYGWRIASTDEWELRIHGWIYEDSVGTAAVKLIVDEIDTDGDHEDEAIDKTSIIERARLFVVDNERGKLISVRIGSETFELGYSGADGHVTSTVRLSKSLAEELQREGGIRDGWLTYQAVVSAGDDRKFLGQVHLVEAMGLAIISDIDDTIKITNVLNREEILQNTFVRPFKPVSGMPELYRRWVETDGVDFFYVSSSPWQLWPALAAFLKANEFPEGAIQLRAFRWKDKSLVRFFESSEDYKREKIEEILEQFPRRDFVLVGDSGERDPEVYSALARQFPKQIKRVFIRNVTKQPRESTRYKDAFKGLPEELYVIFEDATAIRDMLPN